MRRYNSETKQIEASCPTCKKENQFEVKDLELYVGPGNDGVFAKHPKCSCGAVSIEYTGNDPSHLSCHFRCLLVNAAYTSGAGYHLLDLSSKEEDVKREVKEKLDAIEIKYQNNSIEHQQFLGEAKFVFPEPKIVD